MLAHLARRCREWCKYWDDSMPMLPAPLFGNAREPARLSRHCLAGILVRQIDAAGCPQPCKQHPCLRRQAFLDCGNGKRSDLLESRCPTCGAHLRAAIETSQRSQGWDVSARSSGIDRKKPIGRGLSAQPIEK